MYDFDVWKFLVVILNDVFSVRDFVSYVVVVIDNMFYGC